jgi:hypothetical protein
MLQFNLRTYTEHFYASRFVFATIIYAQLNVVRFFVIFILKDNDTLKFFRYRTIYPQRTIN